MPVDPSKPGVSYELIRPQVNKSNPIRLERIGSHGHCRVDAIACVASGKPITIPPDFNCCLKEGNIGIVLANKGLVPFHAIIETTLLSDKDFSPKQTSTQGVEVVSPKTCRLKYELQPSGPRSLPPPKKGFTGKLLAMRDYIKDFFSFPDEPNCQAAVLELSDRVGPVPSTRCIAIFQDPSCIVHRDILSITKTENLDTVDHLVHAKMICIVSST